MLNFYYVDPNYVEALQKAETEVRGFSRVPNMDYSSGNKPKFLCGIVLQINGMDYYVPVSSFKDKKPDNFVIYAKNGNAVSSLRFNYMFPVPPNLVTERKINTETDVAYKNLLFQELRYCIKHTKTIQEQAERTYNRVKKGSNPALNNNSCCFDLLEKECQKYITQLSPSVHKQPAKNSIKDQLSKAQKQSAEQEKGSVPSQAKHTHNRM